MLDHFFLPRKWCISYAAPMRKGISVYSHDVNPDIDAPVFHVSRCEADARIEKGWAVWLSPASIQTRPPGWTQDEERLAGAGTLGESWKPRFSDHYVVMQMVAED